MIRIERPPNYDRIVETFPKAAGEGILFAYGEDIFNPSNVKIPAPLVMHEYRHCARQFMTSPETWWEKYLTDQDFRYHEEVLAHHEEMLEAMKGVPNDRNTLAKVLDRTARRLIAPLYNYDPPRTLRNALHDVQYPVL